MDETLACTLTDRAATYGLLARLFNREVDQNLLDELSSLPPGGDAGSLLMWAYLDQRTPEALTELSVDFTRLFIVRTAKTKDAPYPNESVYASTDNTVMGDARDAVLASYRAEGLDKSSGWNLPEDHIALELEFVQALYQRAVLALHEGDEDEAARLLEVQREFLTQHLGRWIAPFTQTMERWAQTDFYRGLALFTSSFLEEEQLTLAELSAAQ